MLSADLFQPYFTAYGKWRASGLRAMRRDLEEGFRIVAVTMDLRRFYHEVDAQFLLREDYLSEIGITLTAEQRSFTQGMIDAFQTWNQAAHERFGCEARGLPVGLTASGLIANVLLIKFDRQVVSSLTPTYYARYVDDVFLVTRHSEPFPDGEAYLRWLGARLAPIATATIPDGQEAAGDVPALHVNLPYGDGSRLVFVGKKQKIFQLEGSHGIDLIGPIEEQIRQQTSEHRNLPHLPQNESRMAHRALLVTPDATLDADSLRKADAVALRRSGFAMLLGDVEAHARDLEPASWTQLRHQFHELALRHLLTPSAFFDYFRYFPRIVGVMCACQDWSQAREFVRGFGTLLECLRTTCLTEHGNLAVFLENACHTLAMRMIEAVLQSAEETDRQVAPLVELIKEVISEECESPTTAAEITQTCEELNLLDWARVPYSSRWLNATANEETLPRPVNSDSAGLHLRSIDLFRRKARLKSPHWPAIVFPTRPIPLREITTRAPSLLEDWEEFSAVVKGLRRTWMPEQTGLRSTRPPEQGSHEIEIPNVNYWRPRVAITSIEVADGEWAGAANGTPVLTLERYQRLNTVLDAVVSGNPRPNYVVLPECSVPRRWAMQLATKLLLRGVSLIAGLEYRADLSRRSCLHNEALVALRTNFPGYQTGLYLLQPKRLPAWHERELLNDQFGKRLAVPRSSSLKHPVYRHQGFCFGVLICSELTDVENRRRFQGQVDALFFPEWNQDIESFAVLVESAALDVHAYIVQANNRRFGDSRIRAPMKIRYQRDMIRVTGGLNDYFVVGEIDYMALRRFQSHAIPPTGDNVIFKPFPIGFPERLSARRRTTPM